VGASATLLGFVSHGEVDEVGGNDIGVARCRLPG
jgi:hypothetical protein